MIETRINIKFHSGVIKRDDGTGYFEGKYTAFTSDFKKAEDIIYKIFPDADIQEMEKEVNCSTGLGQP